MYGRESYFVYVKCTVNTNLVLISNGLVFDESDRRYKIWTKVQRFLIRMCTHKVWTLIGQVGGLVVKMLAC